MISVSFDISQVDLSLRYLRVRDLSFVDVRSRDLSFDEISLCDLSLVDLSFVSKPQALNLNPKP